MNDTEELESLRAQVKDMNSKLADMDRRLDEQTKNVVDTTIPHVFYFTVSVKVKRDYENIGSFPYTLETYIPTTGLQRHILREDEAKCIFEIYGKKDENKCDLSPLKGKGKCGADDCGCRCQQNRENTHIDGPM